MLHGHFRSSFFGQVNNPPKIMYLNFGQLFNCYQDLACSLYISSSTLSIRLKNLKLDLYRIFTFSVFVEYLCNFFIFVIRVFVSLPLPFFSLSLSFLSPSLPSNYNFLFVEMFFSLSFKASGLICQFH